MLELYQNIKKYRLLKGMSQDELAERVGYNGKSMVSRIENGLIDIGHAKIVQFAEALGVSPMVLMGWKDEEPDVLDKDSEALLRMFRNLGPDRRKNVLQYVREQYLLQDMEEGEMHGKI